MNLRNSGLLASMMKKGKQPVPSNVKYPSSGLMFSLKSGGTTEYFYKNNYGLAYGGFVYFADGGSNWEIAFLISETRSYCQGYRNSGSASFSVSTSTFSYKGKNWYYTLNNNACPYTGSQTDLDYNNSNGKYSIGNGKIYTGANNTEKFIQAGKDLLDYVYSFDIGE